MAALKGPSTSPGHAVANAPVTAAAWATAFLIAIGAPVTQNNINNVVAWGTAESGNPTGHAQSIGGWDRYNPLNVVTQSGDNHIPIGSGPGQVSGGSQGNIASFTNMTDGVMASARLFMGNGAASGIIQTLRSNGSTAQLNSAINGFYSSWGGHINITGINPNSGGVIGNASGGGITGSVSGGSGGGGNSGSLLGVGISDIPILGEIWGGISATQKLASAFLALFKNWRYVVQVFAGGALILLALFLLGKHTLEGRAQQVAGEVGPAAAAAAA